MLTQEVSTLREEVVDFRDRIDELIEQISHFEEQVSILTKELDSSVSFSFENFRMFGFDVISSTLMQFEPS